MVGIVVTEHGATVTIQINRDFAEKLIDYIDKVPANCKAEGDNQVLAGILDREIKRTSPQRKVQSNRLPGWKVRRAIRNHKSAIEFWKRLIENVMANDGSAVEVIRGRMARNERILAELQSDLAQREKDKETNERNGSD